MSAGMAALILVGVFVTLVVLRVPVSFALGLACLPILVMDDDLTPVVLITEMWNSQDNFILLAVPFFLLAAIS